jgi:hypothetical protein
MPNPQIGDTQKAPFAVTELDADGLPVLPTAGDSCPVVSSDVTLATIVLDASPVVDGALVTGFIVAMPKAGTVNITFGPIGKADGTSIGTAIVDVFDIVAGTASQIGVSVGAPVAQ